MTPNRCQVPNCSNPRHAFGLCRQHYDERRNAESREGGELTDPTLRERWVLGWLRSGRGGPFGSEVAPWPCRWRLGAVSIPVIEEWTDPQAVRVDFERLRDELPPDCWASRFFGGSP